VLFQVDLDIEAKSKYLIFNFRINIFIRLFVDRSEAKSIFGQNPGEYHGFASDYTHGGTYKADMDRGMFVNDLNKYTKFKLKQKDFKPQGYDRSEISDSASKCNFINLVI